MGRGTKGVDLLSGCSAVALAFAFLTVATAVRAQVEAEPGLAPVRAGGANSSVSASGATIVLGPTTGMTAFSNLLAAPLFTAWRRTA